MKDMVHLSKLFTFAPVLMVLIAALSTIAAPTLAQTSRESGNDQIKAKFNSSCAACHGKDGAGTGLGKSMQAPDLRSEQVQKHSDSELAQVIAEGKGDMPSFKNSLTADQLRAVVVYIRRLAKKREGAQN